MAVVRRPEPDEAATNIQPIPTVHGDISRLRVISRRLQRCLMGLWLLVGLHGREENWTEGRQ